MQSSSNRSVVIISGLLTLLVLGGAMLTLSFPNGWLQAAPTESHAGAARGATPFPPSTTGTNENDVALYRGELDDAYRALDEAYTQVRALQAAQSQVGPRAEREPESAEAHDERHERRPRHRDADHD